MTVGTAVKGSLGAALRLAPLLPADRAGELTIFVSHSTPKQYRGTFTWMLDQISSKYRWVRPNEIDAFLEEDCHQRPGALLTFDDGYANNSWVAEELGSRDICAIFFLITDFLEVEDWQDFYRSNIAEREVVSPPLSIVDYEPMSWAEAGNLVNLGHTIGSHTRRHRLHALEDPDEVWTELRESRDEIRRRLGLKVEDFASPKDSRLLNEQMIDSIEKNYARHFTTFDVSNAHHGSPHFFRSNLEIYWPKRRLAYAIAARALERFRWRRALSDSLAASRCGFS